MDKTPAGPDNATRRRQWMWFAALWLGGLLTVGALAYILKAFLRLV